MNAGQLKDTITIFSPEPFQNEFGERIEQLVEKYSCKAKVEHRGGSRNNVNGEVFLTNSKIFHIRIYHEINDNDIVSYEGKKYRIIDVEKIKEYQEIILTTTLINE